MVNAILFDLDGILADSEPCWNEIDAAFLKPYGIDYRGEHKQRVLGTIYTISVGFYRQQFALRTEMEQLLLERETIARDFYGSPISLFGSAPGVLAALKEMGRKIGLATSSVADLVLPFLRRHDIEKYFDAITTGDEVTHGKPSPDIYLRPAGKVGEAPDNCLVVEDAIPDARFMGLSLYPGAADDQLVALGKLPALGTELRAN